MEKTLLEIVEELNRRPVSDRVEIPKARDVEKASLVLENDQRLVVDALTRKLIQHRRSPSLVAARALRYLPRRGEGRVHGAAGGVESL